MKAEHRETCIICEQSKAEGINIYASFICADCEEEIVGTDVQDVKYPFFIRQLKNIWLKQDA
ncbi:sigma factor G inhibitor Gin [Marinicrinis sediminis]|uniref:Sigma factor G inhibitor Gin n=1 Tax=Marinicrinis sediminis TaxID=1652465 RepID=A0ABW5R924_9BACL